MKKVEPNEELTTLVLAKKILNSESKKPNKRLVFADKEFIFK